MPHLRGVFILDLLIENVFYYVTLCGKTTLRGVYFGGRACDTILRGDLLVENVFYDPLRLDGEKPLCDESGDISPQDSNNVLHQIIWLQQF